MANIPASPIEKYNGLREHYVLTGKEFDSEAIKESVIRHFVREKGMSETSPQLAMVRRFPVEHIPASEERERSVRRADAEGKRAIEAVKAESEARLREANGELATGAVEDRRVAKLEAELAELKALIRSAGVAAPAAETATNFEPDEVDMLPPLSGNYPVGRMTTEWKKEAMLAFADDHGILVPDDLKGQFVGKAKLADYILERFDEREAVAS